MTEIIIGVIALVVGYLIAKFLERANASKTINNAEEQAASIRKEAESIKKEAELINSTS